MRVLHITAHLGGGVGRILSRLCEAAHRDQDGVVHTIACLEPPQKTGAVEHARRFGAEVVCAPDADQLDALVREADIVQLEWWHHPVTARWMGEAGHRPMRLIIWSHVSGLSVPTLPAGFLALPHRFLLSSTCSLGLEPIAHLTPEARARVDVVFSAAGFDDFPAPSARGDDTPLRIAYIGSLNPAKCHPDLLDFVAAVEAPDFRLDLYGDPVNAPALQAAATARGLSGRIAIHGYHHDVISLLAGTDVFAYPLNPCHYGTAENALLEAMAMGVVPVVLDNPAERVLVEHGRTGCIVRNAREFGDTISLLSRDPALRRRLGAEAAREVRTRFSLSAMSTALRRHYRAVMNEAKRPMDFRAVFGPTPADWFRACQGDEAGRFADTSAGALSSSDTPPPHLLERTKGSVFHFHETFPDDPRLADWARALASCAP